MPRAEFSIPSENVRISRNLSSPSKITSEKAWLTAARKKIPQIPKLGSEWHFVTWSYDTNWIHIELRKSNGVRAYLIVDRKAPSL